MPEKLPPPELLESRIHVLEELLGEFSSVDSVLPPDLRLRQSRCGICSESIALFLRGEGYQAQAMIRHRIPFDDDHSGHVIAVVEAKDPLIIDATYSQFFKQFGIIEDYANRPAKSVFPPEKIAIFRQSDVPVVAEWAAMVVERFQATHLDKAEHARYRRDHRWGELHVLTKSKAELEAYFADIWNLDTYAPFEARQLVGSYAPTFAARLAAQN
jgi:hypothetical protein